MVGRLKLQNQQDQEASTAKLEKMTKAVADWKEEQKKEKSRSLRAFARDYDVDPMTLKRQSEGGRSIHEFNATKQKLTPAEEKTIADYIVHKCEQALPPTPSQIRSYAEWIRKTNHPDKPPIGETWVNEFFKRHPEVSTGWSNALDTQRAQALNPTVVKKWFDLLEQEVEAKGISACCKWGMDETNLQ
ncbi:hypothetical protein D9758_006535 [Tetrapyrgos nigripes]|uniref:HTH CENPB-type domain-containing protein n=1 Tax=Tetrapyrgos nigripes TaxID=182062 RepID=A0A8H5GKN5_9AGAR|nr:hypothetical protein D9758_006535 [Tetrapyrgos nigripes]